MMGNPNRKTTSTIKTLTRKKLSLVISLVLTASLLATIWVGYNQITEKNKQIKSLSNQVIVTNKKLTASEKKNQEVVANLNGELAKQQKIISSLNENIKTLKTDNAKLAKKYRELVTP